MRSKEILGRNIQSILSQASNSQSIVVIGDIRKSQDLMTYSIGSKTYAERMQKFISETLKNCRECGGFFDKFTGDGFIVYFNEYICRYNRINFEIGFLKFVYSQLSMAEALFSEWRTHLRKLPMDEIGLAMGCDRGLISFEDVEENMIATGDSIVWAERMVSSAKGREVVVNNLLYSNLGKYKELLFESKNGTTKGGEAFAAKVIEVSALKAFCEKHPLITPIEIIHKKMRSKSCSSRQAGRPPGMYSKLVTFTKLLGKLSPGTFLSP